MIVAEAASVPTSEVARRLHPIANEQAGLAGDHLGVATMLVPTEDPDGCVRDVHRRLRRDLGQSVTVIGEQVHDHDLSRAFWRASRCVAVVRALGTDDVGSMTDPLALYAILFDVDRSRELDRFGADDIGAVVEYDRRRSTDLVATLDVYFENGGNLRRSADELHVHLDTLGKRLDRVAALLGFDWRDADDLQLRLAVRSQTLRLRLQAGEGSR